MPTALATTIATLLTIAVLTVSALPALHRILPAQEFRSQFDNDPDHPFSLIFESFEHVKQRSQRRLSRTG